MNRRTFLSQAGAATAAATLLPASLRAANEASRKLRVMVVALGRGLDHVKALLELPDVEIAYLAEVDPKRLGIGLKMVGEKQETPCKSVEDFRTVLKDPELDAVFIATPNFWHTPAALLCLQAGKHVYVEKPGSQNPREAELLVAAAARSGKVVGMGNQRRTWMRDAITALHGGALGPLRYARAFYYKARPAIGKGAIPAPADLNLDLWQGPVPSEPNLEIRPFVHYDWHWLWNWGNGELGNNGIHTLDVLRWGLNVGYPKQVTYLGGRYGFADAQQTPDTGTAIYDYGHVGLEWVQSSVQPRAAEKPLAECVFYGDNGTMGVDRTKYTIYDFKGAKVSETKMGAGTDAEHIGNFLDAIRGKAKLNSPIDEGQKSTMLCHLGNIAYRTSTVVKVDQKTGKLLNHPEGEKLWGRQYRPGWEPKA